MKILLVDDEKINLKVFDLLAQAYGETVVAHNGREAIEAYRKACETKAPFDLILLDIRMPDMNGLEALHAIRKIEADGFETKILMVSSEDDNQSILGAFNENCDGYIIKPITHDALKEHMARLFPDAT